MSSLDAEDLIARLSGPLDPADRPAFRNAAEAALHASECWGEGLIHRTVVELWRDFFHPPPDKDYELNHFRRNKLRELPPIARDRAR
jgi:hypothetical protein